MKATSTNDSYPATIYDIGTNTYCIQSKKNNASYFATSGYLLQRARVYL